MRRLNRSLYQTARFTLICIVYMSSFLSAQEETPQQVLDWQQTAEQCTRQNNYECACANHQNIVDTFPQTEYAFRSWYHLALLNIKYGNNTLADEAIQNLLSDYAAYVTVTDIVSPLVLQNKSVVMEPVFLNAMMRL